MPENPNPENREEEPAWAKNLRESLTELPQRIKEALTPEEPAEPEPEPNKIPVPQPPEPEPIPEPEPTEPEPEPEPKKSRAKSLMDFLL